MCALICADLICAVVWSCYIACVLMSCVVHYVVDDAISVLRVCDGRLCYVAM